MSSNYPSLFISYSRQDDEAFAKRLWHYLDAHGFKVWWDRKAMESRGLTFQRELRDAIEAAGRTLLIVGPQVKHSPYVEMEWRHALRTGGVVTPVLRLGNYDDVPEALQSLHVEDVRSSIPEQEVFENLKRIASTPIPPFGPLIGVPRLPSPYLERSELIDHLRSRILIDSYQPIDLQADQRITSVAGMGGIGKTVLSVGFAHAPDIRRSFQDGIYWIRVGRQANTLDILKQVGLAIGDEDIDYYTGFSEARLLIGKKLATKNCLIILDDVWDIKVIEALHTAASGKVRILLTSRQQNLFASAGVHVLPIDVLSKTEALEMLAEWTKTPLDELPKEAISIAQECGYLPLALAMIGALIRSGPDRWSYALERLRRADPSKIKQELPDYEYESLDRAMLASFEELKLFQKEKYLDLVVLPEGAAAPRRMLQKWWTAEGEDELEVVALLDELVDRSLLRVDEHDAYSLHDVQRDFLAIRVEDRQALHFRWLLAFEPPKPGDWASVDDDGYLFDRLGYHLKEASREQEWRNLLLAFSWLQRKTELRGFPAVLLDLAVYSENPEIGPLYRIFRRSAHILKNDPAQLSAQLLARAEGLPSLQSLLDEARIAAGRPSLLPVWPSLGEKGEPTLAVFRGREEDGHAGTPRSIALSPNGKLILSGGGSSNDLTVKVWSAEAGILLRTYKNAVDAGGRTLLTFVTSDGRFAAASTREVCFYTLEAEEPIARIGFEDSEEITSICSAVSGLIFIGFQNGQILAWNPVRDSTRSIRLPDNERVLTMAHASGSSHLAIATEVALECIHSQEGQLLSRIEEQLGQGGLFQQPPPMLINPKGDQICFGNPLRIWKIDENSASLLLKNIDCGPMVDLSADYSIALCMPSSKELVTIDITEAREIGRIKNTREFSCLKLSQDGDAVATGDFEHDVKLWDLLLPNSQLPEWTKRGRVNSVAFTDDGSMAFIATAEGPEFLDLATGQPLKMLKTPAKHRAIRRGKPLLNPEVEEQIRSQLQKNLFGEKKELMFLSGDPLGELAFSKTANRAVSAPSVQAKFADMEEPAFDPSSQGASYPLKLWDLHALDSARSLYGHTMPITCVDMTENGTFALTGSWGRILRLWNLDTGTCIQTMRGHRGIIQDCALTADARFAISGSEDMTVRLWDLVKGKLLFTFSVSSWVTACDISSDGSMAIAAETSGRVHVLSVKI